MIVSVCSLIISDAIDKVIISFRYIITQYTLIVKVYYKIKYIFFKIPAGQPLLHKKHLIFTRTEVIIILAAVNADIFN